MAKGIDRLQVLINEKLKPIVKKIDEEAFYPADYLYSLGRAGYFDSSHTPRQQLINRELLVIEKTAEVCMTTAFCLWCHLASLIYLRHTENIWLNKQIRTSLESGQTLGATGLSNPMKYYSQLEDLHLSAKPIKQGYQINGVLPYVSNLALQHWFGAIARVANDREVMILVPANHKGLSLVPKQQFVGVNGSATYQCKFNNVQIPDQFVIADDAKPFIERIRPLFILYQIPIGMGVITSAINGMKKVKAKQNGCNFYLKTQANKLEKMVYQLKNNLQQIVEQEAFFLPSIVQLRLQTAYGALEAVQANMLHHGSAGYLQGSEPYRKLKEAYFFANLTPTIKHLEKMQTQLQTESRSNL